MLKKFLVMNTIVLFSSLTLLAADRADRVPLLPNFTSDPTSSAAPKAPTPQANNNPIAVPTPHFEVLTATEFESLKAHAKKGNEEAITELAMRVYWGANHYDFTTEDMNAVKNIKTKIQTADGYHYWHIIFLCDGFSHFQGLEEKIKGLATKFATAQYLTGLVAWKKTNAWGTRYELDKALEYWEKAAGQNFAPALVKLGEHYEERGEQRRALEYYQRAAAQKHLLGLKHLGDFYHNGIEVEKNVPKAIALYFASNQSSVTSYIREAVRPQLAPSTSLFDPKAALQEIENARDTLARGYNISCRVLPDDVPNFDACILFRAMNHRHDEWMDVLAQLVPALQKIDPGFMIASFKWKHPQRQDKNFFFEHQWNDEEFLTIGERNIATLKLFTAHLTAYEKLHTQFEKFLEQFEFSTSFVEEKLKKYKVLQHGLDIRAPDETSPDIAFFLKNCVKSKLGAYQAIDETCDLKSKVDYVKTWKEDARKMKELLDSLVTKGKAQRDYKFFEAYPYLKRS